MANSKSLNGFLELKLDGERSIASDIPDNLCRGIYAYEFTDSTWYVGKASDVRKRHAQHLHEYRHETPPLIMSRMLWLPLPGSSDDKLDRVETEAITAFERIGYNLRNLMKTGRPGGTGDMSIEAAGSFGVEVPWERTRRQRAAGTSRASNPKNRTRSMKARFKKLSSTPWWPKLLSLLSTYAHETIPAPDALGCLLWTATAMTKRRGETVLCCLSVGNIETLVVFEDGPEPLGFLNLKGSVSRPHMLNGAWFREADYRSAEDVTTAHFDSLDVLASLLTDPSVLDACYRLNAEMIRKGSCMYTRFSNAFLVDAILEGISVVAN